MPISFNNIPANWRMPLYWVEVDPSMAGYPSSPLPSLLIGNMLPVGTAPPDVPTPVASVADAQVLFGYGSMLDGMAQAFFTNNFAQEVWAIPITPASAGVAASGTFTIATAANAAGTLPVYVAGRKVQVLVDTVDTVDEVATNIVAAINADLSMPVIATAAAGVVTLTCKWAGETGNDIDFRFAYGGSLAAENIPFGLTITMGSGTAGSTGTTGATGSTGTTRKLAGDTDEQVGVGATGPTGPSRATGSNERPRTKLRKAGGGKRLSARAGGPTTSVNKLTGGTGTCDLTNAVLAMGDEPYEYVAVGFTDSDALFALEQEFGFGDNGRWGWMRQIYGHLFSAYRGIETAGDMAGYDSLMEYGPNNNSGVLSIMAIEANSPTPFWCWAAAYTAMAARALLNDPARPLQTLQLTGCLPAPRHQRFTMRMMNDFAWTGLATQAVNANQIPAIKRETTTYQKNLYAQGDDAYELVTTLATLAALFRRQRFAITTKYPRHKLADDGTIFGAGQAIVTPNIIRAELIAEYSFDEFTGLVENTAAFKANLIVERDANDPNRVNVLYPPDLINQLRIFAVLAQFRLQYNRGLDSVVAT